MATGRSAASCAATLEGLRLPLPAIVHNGALTCELHSGRPGAIRAMDGPAAGRFFADAVAEGLSPIAYGLDEEGTTWLLHSAQPNLPTRRYLDSLRELHQQAVDDGGWLARLSPLSMLLLDEPARLADFLGRACRAGSGFASSLGRSAYTPGLGVGEVQADRATKGQAALDMCASLGLSPAELVAFGDGGNDLPLLRLAGGAFCPPDAQPEVLAQVEGRIACAADEGVAAYLEELLGT